MIDIGEQLSIGKTKSIRITPQRIGNFRFTCHAQMYQEQLKVVD